jgi:hypothetical protein
VCDGASQNKGNTVSAADAFGVLFIVVNTQDVGLQDVGLSSILTLARSRNHGAPPIGVAAAARSLPREECLYAFGLVGIYVQERQSEEEVF